MIADLSTAIVFESVPDMAGMKNGVYLEEGGQRKILVSPAIYSLLHGDEKAAVLERLMVSTDDGLRWVFDIFREEL